MKIVNKLINRIFNRIFKSQLTQLQHALDHASQNLQASELLMLQLKDQKCYINEVFDKLDVSVDVHQYEPSWAVISLQGKKMDYVKFIDLGDSDIREIASFLRQFERRHNIKVDASPGLREWLKIDRIKNC